MPIHYLEDWMLVMYGSMDIQGISAGRYAAFNPPIKLATYDKEFIKSVAEAIQRNHGMTDRQIQAAVLIINKYKRQWEGLGLDPSYLLVDEIPLRLPQRHVDRTKAITVQDKTIYVVFPYNKELISEFHNMANLACGNWKFEKTPAGRRWEIDLTEGNICLLAKMKSLDLKDYTIDPFIKGLLDEARLAIVSGMYAPCMGYEDGKMVLTNVPKVAEDFLASQGWTPTSPDLLQWALMARKLALEIDPSLLDVIPYSKSLLEPLVNENNYTGVSSTTWDQFRNVVNLLPGHTFIFFYRQRSLDHVRQLVGANPAFHFYSSDKDGELSVSTLPSTIDTKKTILVTDLIIGANAQRKKFISACLGMLYMIPDDRRTNADMQTHHQG